MIWHKTMIKLWALVRADARYIIRNTHELNISWRNAQSNLHQATEQLTYHRAAYTRLKSQENNSD